MNIADIILSAGRCQTEDEASEAVKVMLSPSNSREEMGEVYKTVMGYNPLSFFDENEIRESVKTIIRNHDRLRKYLQSEEIGSDRIVEMAMTIHDSHLKKNQMIAIKEAIWALCPSLPTEIYEDVMDIEVPSDEYEISPEVEDEDDDEEFMGLEEDDDIEEEGEDDVDDD